MSQKINKNSTREEKEAYRKKVIQNSIRIGLRDETGKRIKKVR